MAKRRPDHEEVMSAPDYTPFGAVPDDRYEVVSVVRDEDGTAILLGGERYSVKIYFGFVEVLCICDEGRRIESYNRIGDIQTYRKNDFFGCPLYKVGGDSGFMRWLNEESCGFSFQDGHYAVITLNDFIDIAAAFPPKIEIS